jgi:hypothetical protein
MNQYVSFASQQPSDASIIAVSSNANTCVASRSRSPLSSIQPVAIVFRGDQSLGVRRNACFWPPMRPKPTICPDELMLEASTSVQPDPLGI